MTQYRIYGFDECPYCEKATAFLRSEGIPYQYISIRTPEERKAWMDERGFEVPNRTFPRIYRLTDEGEVLVGGFSDIEEAHWMLASFQ